MACGTGKTLVALWTAEKLKSSKILVLFPSLALIRQTLHEWLKETHIENLSYICICSDVTVAEGADMPSVSKVDLDFNVTTNSTELRGFLNKEFNGVKIVFSTYQSAKVVGDAQQGHDYFDLAIFDEAHKTAGSEGRNLTFALEDRNIRIRKRVFLTATPRHYRPQRNKTKDDESQLVFSMDRPEVYGPRVYNLPFSKAIEIGAICRYKVIISAITSSSVNAELLNRGKVNVNGDDIYARQVANQISICDAVKRYGVKKIFTFHSKVESAKSFVSQSSEGIGSHLPDYMAMHVNGGMSTSERERTIKDFKDAPHALISNARCLT
jgi:predicted helicase